MSLKKLLVEVKQLTKSEKKRLLEFLRQEIEPTVSTGDLQRESSSSSSKPIALNSVDAELTWLMANGEALQKYRGEYIALKGEQFIAHGTLGEVLAESKRRGIERPFTQYIPINESEWMLGQGNYPINET